MDVNICKLAFCTFLVENQVVNDEILTEHGSQINSEDKILYKDNIKEDNSEKLESVADEICSLDRECSTESIAATGSLEEVIFNTILFN